MTRETEEKSGDRGAWLYSTLSAGEYTATWVVRVTEGTVAVSKQDLKAKTHKISALSLVFSLLFKNVLEALNLFFHIFQKFSFLAITFSCSHWHCLTLVISIPSCKVH